MTHPAGAVDISVKIGRLALRAPVLLASGTCGYGVDLAGVVDLGRLGGIVTKTVTVKPRRGNQPPRIAETPSGMLNSIGLENVGLERFLKEIAPALRELPTAVVVSVGGESVEEYVKLVSSLAAAGCGDAVELNVSCPNVKGGMAFGWTSESARELTAACRRCWPRTLVVKLTPNAWDVAAVARACEDAGADALTVSNTYLGMKIDPVTRKPALSKGCGGLSGPAIRPLAVAKVWEVSKAVRVPIIGSGGVCNYSDALEHILAGASAVQVGTATFVSPGSAEAVVQGLERHCLDNGVSSLRTLVGGLIVE
jgi:dihydroorotate dehydrogenase (NAD+) catalytic subunit